MKWPEYDALIHEAASAFVAAVTTGDPVRHEKLATESFSLLLQAIDLVGGVVNLGDGEFIRRSAFVEARDAVFARAHEALCQTIATPSSKSVGADDSGAIDDEIAEALRHALHDLEDRFPVRN